MPYLKMLFENKIDNQYYILNSYKEFSDIVQYSAKYMNIHFVSVPTSKLDKAKEL